MTNPPSSPAGLIDTAKSALRASDSEREQAAKLLRHHCTEGRLNPDELSDRLDRAYRARDLGDLAVLFDDLPSTPSVITRPSRRFSARLPRHLIAIPTAAAIIALGAVTDVHGLWLAWPLLAVYRLRRPHHPSRRSLAAGG